MEHGMTGREVLAITLLVGCSTAIWFGVRQPTQSTRTTVDTVFVFKTDSLKDENDSLRALLRKRTILLGLGARQMMRYAKIVRANPTQSVFIVGWTRRAFDGLGLPDSVLR
jgi:hypothetical protein